MSANTSKLQIEWGETPIRDCTKTRFSQNR